MITLKDAIQTLKGNGSIQFDNEIATALQVDKSLISNIKKGREDPSLNFIDKFREKYGIEITPSESLLNKQSLDNAKRKYKDLGYNPTTTILNTDQQNTLTMAISSVSYASLELLCRVVAVVENKPLEEVRKEANQLTHERLRKIEGVLNDLVSLS